VILSALGVQDAFLAETDEPLAYDGTEPELTVRMPIPWRMPARRELGVPLD
jgi:hypothetical protein